MEEKWEVVKKQRADLWIFFFFKIGVKLLGATMWENMPGKEFNREKIKADRWRRSQLLNACLSPWSLNSFIPVVS